MRELKVALQEDVILPFLNPEIYAEYKVSLPNGILLYGPPGCGKTFIARKLAGILNFTFFEIKPSDLSSIYAHGGQTKIRELFNAAEEKAPSMIFFDEIDALIPRRSDSNVSHHYKGEVNEFLTQLDKSWDRRILIIGATNFLESLDSAVLRPGRIDKKIFIGPPDFEARVELLKEYMKGRPQEIIDWLDLGDRLEFYTAAEIEYVVNEAARKALNRRENISNNDLVEIIYRNPSQLNKNKVDEIRNPIGFL